MYNTLANQLLNNEDDNGNEDELLPGQMILFDEIPTEEEWCYAPLYATDQMGKLRIWQIGFDPRTNELVWNHGIVNGFAGCQTDRSAIYVNESGRNLLQQALLEAKKRITDKQRDGYRFEEAKGDDIDLAPQLAKIYYPPGSVHPTNGKKQSCQIKPNDFPVWVQVKINGVRGTIQKVGNQIKIRSRKTLEYLWLEDVRVETSRLLEFLPPGIGLDSELYNHEMPLERIIAAVRTTKFKHQDNDKIVAHIFDLMIPNVVLEDRYVMLLKAYQEYLKKYGQSKRFCIITHTPANSYEDIQIIHDEAVERGYEGIAIRWPSKDGAGRSSDRRKKLSLYKGDRNNNLLKYKGFEDAEGTIIDVVDGDGRSTGLAKFTIREDKTGIEFDCNPRGTAEKKAYWFQNKHLCIGKRYTYRFIGRTIHNKPNHNTGVAFRDYE